jgi:hypothetical protein
VLDVYEGVDELVEIHQCSYWPVEMIGMKYQRYYMVSQSARPLNYEAQKRKIRKRKTKTLSCFCFCLVT